jgi:hypothetical protein
MGHCSPPLACSEPTPPSLQAHWRGPRIPVEQRVERARVQGYATGTRLTGIESSGPPLPVKEGLGRPERLIIKRSGLSAFLARCYLDTRQYPQIPMGGVHNFATRTGPR